MPPIEAIDSAVTSTSENESSLSLVTEALEDRMKRGRHEHVKHVAIVDDDLVKVTLKNEIGYYFPPSREGRLVKSDRSDGTYHFVWTDDGTLEKYVRPDGSFLKFSNNKWQDHNALGQPTGRNYETFEVQDLKTGKITAKEGPITSADLSLGATFDQAQDERTSIAYLPVSAAAWENVGLIALSKFDKDGNAYLDLDEIDAAINNSAKQYLSSHDEQFLFSARKNFDFLSGSDSQAGISRSDITSAAVALRWREKEQLLSKYKMDATGDGKISVAELETASRRLKTKAEVQIVADMIRDAKVVGGYLNEAMYAGTIDSFGKDNTGTRQIDKLAYSNELIARIKSEDAQSSKDTHTLSIEPADIKQAEIGNCPIMASLLGLSLTDIGREHLKRLVSFRDDGKIEVKFPGFRPVVLDRPNASLFAMVTPSSNIAVWALQQAAGIINQETNDDSSIKSIKIPALTTNNPEKNMRQIGPHQLLLGDVKPQAVGINDGFTSVEELDKRMSEIQNSNPIIWTIGTGGRLNAAQSNFAFSGSNWNDLGQEDRKKLLQQQNENPADYPGIEKLLNGHAYTVERYNPETKIVRIRNPHDGSAFIDVPLATLQRAFSEGGYTVSPR